MSANIILIECRDANGKMTARERVAFEGDTRKVTIGRSVLADVTLNDEYLAALHASIEVTPGGAILASDLDSVNGIVVDGERHHKVESLALSDNKFQIGRTHVSVRTSRDSLAPEKLEHLRPARLRQDAAWITGISALVVAAQLIYTSWLTAPSDLLSVIVTSVSGVAVIVAIWVAFWALLSRILQGEWRWLRHAAIILSVFAISLTSSDIIALVSFMFSLPNWIDTSLWIGIILLAAALYFHMRHSSSLTVRRAGLLAGIIPALIFGISHWITARSTAKDVNHISAEMRIYPPAFRLRAAHSLDTYFDSISQLRNAADQMRDALPRTDNGD